METKKLFFELLRYTIKGETLSNEAKKCVTNEDISALFVLAKKHDLAPILAYALNQNALIQKDNKVHQKFLQEQSIAVFRYENINYELNKAVELFEKHKILNIPLKGSVIRSLYPQPWLRTSCDIDILIKEEDSERAIKILTEEYGCKYVKCFDYEISLDTPGNIRLELHTALEGENTNQLANQLLKTVWQTAMERDGYAYCKRMPDEMYYFYHVTHLAKHFSVSGCGVRPFIDLKLLDDVKDCNQEKRSALIEQGGLTVFCEKAKKLASVWLNNAEHDQVTMQMEEYVLDAGMLGTIENNVIANQSKKGGKFRYALSRVFLSYDVIKNHYPVLKKHKWLLPFYQVKRWFKLLFCGGVKRSVKELKGIKNLSNERIKNRENMMKNLKLWD